jgi:hypothetical protein
MALVSGMGPVGWNPWGTLGARCLLALVTLGLAAGETRAQTVDGVLLQSATGDPLGGAYVVLLDADSSEVTRALTNSLGRFTVRAPRAGTYRLRTERIGSKSIVSEPIELGEGGQFEIVMRVEPVVLRLDPLTIEGARECRVIGDQALQVLAVWEEARKALTAVAWAGPREQLLHEMEHFERWYTPNFRMVHEIRETIPTHRVMPFRSRSVDELEEQGYVIVAGDSVVYEAPDAEVFFSEPFLQHHCFRLEQREGDGRDVLGLRFEPVKGRDTPDVKGVFWLDAATGALEDLQLEYVNVGVWQRERGAAGELQFEQLPDGRWFVSSWWIRMPSVRRREGMQGPVWQFQEAVVGFKQEGGEVVRVYAMDGRTVYARGRATATGIVFDSTTGAGLPGAFVRLQGTDRVTISDAAGGYWLTDLPEGDYTVTFTHPRATLFGLGGSADRQEVDLEIGTVVQANLSLPSLSTIVNRLCTASTDVEQGLLVGRIRDAATDSIVPRARVGVVWLEQTDGRNTTRRREVAVDSRGVYRTCVPRAAMFSVEVTAPGRPMKAVPTMFGENPLHVVDIEFDSPMRGKREKEL